MNLKELFANKNYENFGLFIEKNKNNDSIIQDVIYFSIDEALKNNDLNFIKNLFLNGIDINKKHDFLDEDLLSTDLIGFSVSRGLLELTQLLLDNGANPNSINNGHSLISQALSRKYNHVVKLLIDRGANINLKDQPSLLNISIINNDIEMVIFLIEKGVKINIEHQADPLLLSLGVSNEIAKIILESSYSFNIDTLIENEKPIEAFSIYDGLDLEIYDKIIEKISREIDINYSVNYGLPAIHKLIMSGNTPFIKILIKHGMDINKKIVMEDTKLLSECTPLFLAVHLGKEHIIRELISLGAEINTKSKKYTSPLALSLHNGNVRIFDYLVKNGANINEDVVLIEDRNETKMNMIHYVAQYNKPEMLQSLLSVGENINRPIISENKIFDGATPLMLAVYYGAIDTIDFLINNKADINYQNKDGYSALAYAALTGQKEVFNILLKNDANSDIMIENCELIDLVKVKAIKKEILKKNIKNKNFLWKIKRFI